MSLIPLGNFQPVEILLNLSNPLCVWVCPKWLSGGSFGCWVQSCYSRPSTCISGGWRWPFNILGFIAIILSLGGALFELQSLRKNEAYGYWGMAAVFLIPAALLHLAVTHDYFATPLEIIVRIAVLILIVFGGSLFSD